MRFKTCPICGGEMTQGSGIAMDWCVGIPSEKAGCSFSIHQEEPHKIEFQPDGYRGDWYQFDSLDLLKRILKLRSFR
jgi:hypothetical protein